MRWQKIGIGLAIAVIILLSSNFVQLVRTQENDMIGQTENTREVVQAFNQAQQSGDMEKILELFSNDAQWRVDGTADVPWVGDHRGKEEIRTFLTTFSENIEVVEAQNTAQIADGNDMIMLNQMKLKIKKNNEPINSNSVVHFHVENGKITQHNVYENTYDVAVAWRGTPRSQLSLQKGTPFFSDNLDGATEARLALPTIEETSREVRSRLEQLPTVLNLF